ncbi:uncharacterized protein FIBRA_01088 [Fibroporia radiculosa]|uniref:Uncharacterized protein n=1 Tax=Fibroporia radiculosa TaxID=599839 RepID=J4I8A6_9APHY|nr:uncharacterized protein FIBRA_01088 [Fibroporia radiculosa]CCL99076.1 predicted protein [Fibroporia radiculosa]
MSTRRRVGFSTSSSEASRRQLMQPVPCWEKAWILPENAAPGSTLRIYKWVKTEKKQQFSDDEGETDQPLAPLPEPDEIEVVEGDEELDQDEAAVSVVPETTTASREVSMPAAFDSKEELKPASPKPHPLSISFQPPSPAPGQDDALDESLKPLGGELDAAVGADALGSAMSLDMSQMGPDGEPFEDAQDLSQLQSADALLGGALMDDPMDDPFAVPPES